MSDNLRFSIGDRRLAYHGPEHEQPMTKNNVAGFNYKHGPILQKYHLQLAEASIVSINNTPNGKSNLGAFRNRKLRESVILAAALPAAAVALDGRASLLEYPESERKAVADGLKRANDRTAAQVMAEVLQTTAETLPSGEDVIIQSAFTEGVRVKPGYEAGGNPTIAVGALYGKEEHKAAYGQNLPSSVTMLTMGNDVIEGTTKSIKGLHSSLTSLFVTESYAKRHLPDIYVQRWMSGAYFPEFNPRETSMIDAAKIIAEAYGISDLSELTAFFLNRARHYPAMDELNTAGISTPTDNDGDLFPGIVLGMEGLEFPDGHGLSSMIGEIGGSAEWAVGVLPLVWRGGQAIGMLASQSTLTNRDLPPEEIWNNRFHYTEEEFMQIQDTRFEQKPYFTITDIIEDPFAGGVSAFGGITDNYLFPGLTGASADVEKKLIHTNALMINSLGITELWKLTFACDISVADTIAAIQSPKRQLEGLTGKYLEHAIITMLEDQNLRKRLRIFFYNEYYPALIPVQNRMVVLSRSLEALIERGALQPLDREIVKIVRACAPEWFLENY